MNIFIKSLVWRIFGILTLGILMYLFVGNLGSITLFVLLYHFVFVFVFYAHEVAWKNIKMEGKKRSIIKALFYEIVLVMGLGGSLILAFTGDVKTFTNVVFIYTIIRLVAYYFYDRAWNYLLKQTKNEKSIV